MTKEQKMEAFRLRLEGWPYEAIARKIGMTRQNVHQSLADTLTAASRKKYMAKVRSIYPAINDWCLFNEVTIMDLALLMDMHYITLRKSLKGERKFRGLEVARLIDVTGMQYEEIFAQ